MSSPRDARLPQDFAVAPNRSSIEIPVKDGHGPAVFAGFLGWTLDAFDFFLVVLCLTAIAKEFHRSDAEIAFSITLTLAFRPVGAFIFGLMADRYGRRIPLMIDLIFYSVVEVATGFAHSFTTFLVLRALFGIGMGGEWGVGASLAMEKVPPKLRGFLSGMLQQGYALGYLLAAVCFYFVFPRWGWRPMFFIGGLPALLGLFVRFKVKESEVWKKTRHSSWGNLGREIISHWKLFLYLTLLMMMMNFASHGTQDMFPTFLQRHWGMGPTQRAVVTAISMVGAILGGLLVGLLSDRFGRRKAMVASLICAVRIGAVMGLCALCDLAHHRRFLDPVHGAGSVGHHSSTPFGIVARLGARIPSRLRVSVRRASGRDCRLHRGDPRPAHHLRERHGPDGIRGVHIGGGCGGFRSREERH